jgi:hypothetical protein
MLTKEVLLAKKAELQQAYDKALAESQAFGGALQFCQHLIDELDKEEISNGSDTRES